MIQRAIIWCGLILFIASCGGGAPEGTSTVSITITRGGTAGTALQSAAAAPAPPALTSFLFTISGPNMATITRSVSYSGQAALTETFQVPNGNSRVFLVEARDAAATTFYSGTSTVNLTGSPTTVLIQMRPARFWTRQFGTAEEETGMAIARDGSGNVIIAGYTFGDLVSANTDTTKATPDVFVAKFDAFGFRLWTRKIGTPAYDLAYGVAADSSGNIYVAGATAGSLPGNPTGHAVAGLSDCFLAKFDASGTHLWTRQLGAAGYFTFADAVAVDSAGNIVVAGFTEGGLDGIANLDTLNTDPQNKFKTNDIFVVKYDASGTKLWTKQFGTAFNDVAEGIGAGPADSIYVTGFTSGNLSGQNAGLNDAFVMKLDPSGTTVLWTQQFGTADIDQARALAVDSASGAVVIAGETYGDLGDVNTNAGNADLFIAKFNTAGVKQWTQQAGSASNDNAWAVAMDASGNIFASGESRGSVDDQSNAGLDDVLVVKYNASGVKQWARQIGTGKTDRAYGIVADAAGSVYLTGATGGGIDGNTNANSDGTADIADVFLLKYDADGVKQ